MRAERSIRELLGDRNYGCIWAVGGLTGVVRWLQLLVLGVYTFETTGSPLLVSLVPVMWMAPLALGGPMIGVVADRVNRRSFLLLGLAGITALYVATAVVAYSGPLTFTHIAITSILSGVFWTTDIPVRRRLMGDLAADSLSTGMSWDSATGNATRMAGPLLGGIMLQYFSMTGVFVLSAIIYAICFVLTMLTGPAPTTARAASPAFIRDLVAGVRFVAGDPKLRRIFNITIVFNLFGFPFTSMIPVLGRAQLDLSTLMVGVLSSTEGLGAVIGATVIAVHARPRYFYTIYLGGATVYLVMLVYLSVLAYVAGGPMHSFMSASSALFIIGLCSAAYAAMQSTLTYLAAPPEFRSRVLGVLTLCIGTGPIGFFNVGWMAEAYGVPTSLAVTALEGLFVLVVILAFTSAPKITGYFEPTT